ncbi:uncharacterized protein ARMOST_22427 [Armillaria ostoyae]|uniref:Reverse transcriptase/retrotransposon-derived protein RNase H-like domain-containing protein n=1 Tax=Armillaria ostoyae TaxID=47428 RepID=A0A284SCW0_ARMOS|nr:uncharacterized protein ARMOST_22427 [Armillaria ostoyae]
MPTSFVQTFEQTSSNHPRQEPPEGSSVVPDPYEARIKKGEKIGPLKCAADSISLRSIVPVVDHQLKVECIIDSGSQVISMSEAMCLCLGLIYDPTVILEMQSANGTTNYSLGLAQNVEFLFGDITLYLQVHIIWQSVYDILLSRPFNMLTQSIMHNYADENQTITIHDPNTGKTATIPTIPHEEPENDIEEIALVIELDANQEPKIIAYAASQTEFDSEKASTQYLSACDPNKFPIQPTTFTQSLWSTETVYSSTPYAEFSLPTDRKQLLPLYSIPTQIPQDLSDFHSVSQPRDYMYCLYVSVFAGKKYKPVVLKTKPVLATLPDKFRIIRNIRGDPLADIPMLSPTPPPFIPTERYTQERKEYIDSIHNDGFLWPEEMKLMHHFMMVQEKAFAWEDSERGSFRKEFFPPIDIPVVEHTPWVLRNIPIPPGIYAEVCRMIKTKIDTGVYEPSNSSYRSRWFTVLKKDGKSLRIVHSLEPLNEVTIAHSRLLPTTDPLTEHFAGHACGATLDLFVGYDERLLAESSRDLTTFQTPYGALQLVTLPMGWTNSVPIFHDDVTFILQPEIPDFTIPYIDDVPVRGPETRYEIIGGYKTIPLNHGIRQFIWEHFQNLNRIVQRMKYCGGMFSGKKAYLCCAEITVLGHRCTYSGRLPLESIVASILRWGPCIDVSDMHAFIGTVGVLQIFIDNFTTRALPITKLFRKDVPFKFKAVEIATQEDLKDTVKDSPVLRPLSYTSTRAVILAIDTGPAAVGYYLAQCDPVNPEIRYFTRFGSITLNECECGYSQAKKEIFGLYHALGDCKSYLIGLPMFIVEVDASAIKGMLKNPDIAPSAAVN